jgi:hypothetical protein
MNTGTILHDLQSTWEKRYVSAQAVNIYVSVVSYLSGVAHIAQSIVRRRHGDHLSRATNENLRRWHLESRATEDKDADKSNNRVDAALNRHHEERQLKPLAIVLLLVHILLQQRKERERTEDANDADDELKRGRKRHDG